MFLNKIINYYSGAKSGIAVFVVHIKQKQVNSQKFTAAVTAAVLFCKCKTDRLPTVCFAIVCFMKMNVQCEHFIFIYYTIFSTEFQVQTGGFVFSQQSK